MGKLNELLSKIIDRLNASVKTDAQHLTSAQQAQVRANIGAINTWADLGGKPFGDVYDTVTWDGNTEGRANFAGIMYKVSDAIPAPEDLSNGGKFDMYVNNMYNTTYEFTNEDVMPLTGDDNDGIWIITEESDSGYIFIVNENGLAVENAGASFPETGVYFANFNQTAELTVSCRSLTINGYTGFNTTKQIESKYIPDEVADRAIDKLEKSGQIGCVETTTGTLTFDGDTAGKTVVAGNLLGGTTQGVNYVKVLDRGIAESEINSFTVCVNINGTVNTETYYVSDVVILYHPDDNNSFIVTTSGDEDARIASIAKPLIIQNTIIQPGTYLYVYSADGVSAYASEVNGIKKDAIRKIDPVYYECLAWDNTETIEILPDAEYEFTDGYCDTNFVLQINGTYTVTIDDVEYSGLKAFEYHDANVYMICLGNGLLGDLDGYGDPSLPFVVGYSSEMNASMIVAYTSVSGEEPLQGMHTVSVMCEARNFQKIDPKFYDRLAWTYEKETLIYETSGNFVKSNHEDFPFLMLCGGFNFVTDYPDKAIIVIDGVRYECEKRTLSNGDISLSYYGNLYFANSLDSGSQSAPPDTGESFLFLQWHGGTNVFFLNDPTLTATHTICFIAVEEAVKQIDPKYLPEGGFGYTERNVVPVYDGTLTFEESEAEIPYFGLTPGDSYVVNWNGVEYQCKCKAAMTQGNDETAINNFIGNLVPLTNIDTGEPFVIAEYHDETYGDSCTAMFLGEPIDTCTISISKVDQTIHKIDNEYMPAPTWNEIAKSKVELCDVILGDFTLAGAVSLDYKLFDLVEGQTYEVVWDGASYTSVCSRIDGDDLSIGSMDENTPYGIIAGNDGTTDVLAFRYDDGGTSIDRTQFYHSIIVNAVNIAPINADYIPSTTPTIKTAEVGQAIVVKSVDENGMPTEWEAVNVAGGGIDTTGAEEGAFLRFVDGQATWAVIDSAEEVTF